MTGCQPPHRPTGDLIARGVKRPSPAGTATFIGLRALDPLLQYGILVHGLGTGVLARLGVSTLSLSATAFTRTGFRIADQSGLPLEPLIVLSMAVGSAAKQIFWLTCVSQEEFPTKSAVIVSAYNSLCNSANSLLLLTTATSAALWTRPFTVPVPGTRARLSIPVALGTLMYTVGILLETASEVQRKTFKDKPEHKGKLCREGLWAVVRHVNYAGYTLWRGGYALATGGWVAGLAIVTFQVQSFVHNGIPSLDYYMSRRYKDQWGRYKEDVPYKLCPGIY